MPSGPGSPAPPDAPGGLAPWAPEPDPSALPPPQPEPEPVPAAIPAPPAPAVPAAPDPGGRRLGCHGSTACRRLIALGTVAGGLGLAGIAAGTAFLVRPDAVDPDDPTTLISYRPAGAAVLAVGSGFLATWLLTLLAAARAGNLARRRARATAQPSSDPPGPLAEGHVP